MNATELAQAMLKWQELMDQVKLLESDIKTAVLEMGKTQTVGNVRASYSGGRRTYDYKTPGANAPVVVIAEHTKTEIITDWKAVCEEAGIEPVMIDQSPPSVIIKMVG